MNATGFISVGPRLLRLRVVSIGLDFLTFQGGYKLESYHPQDCCESHYLSFADFSIKDLESFIFDFDKEPWFERVPEFGIRLLPVNGHPIPVPGYACNNGYYSDELKLILTKPDGSRIEYDITECQKDTDV